MHIILNYNTEQGWQNADALSKKYSADDIDKQPCIQCQRRGFYNDDELQDACQARGGVLAVYQEVGDDYYAGGEEIDLSIPRVREAADFDRLGIHTAKFDGLAVCPLRTAGTTGASC